MQSFNIQEKPEELKPYMVTNEEIYWPPPEGFTAKDLMRGTLNSSEELIPFSEVTLSENHITNGKIVDRMRWDYVEMVSSILVPYNGALLIFSGLNEDGTVVESLVLDYNNLATYRETLLRQVLQSVLAEGVAEGDIESYEGNVDWLFTTPPAPVSNIVLSPLVLEDETTAAEEETAENIEENTISSEVVADGS